MNPSAKSNRQLKIDHFFVPNKRAKMEQKDKTVESEETFKPATSEKRYVTLNARNLPNGEGCSKDIEKPEDDSEDSETFSESPVTSQLFDMMDLGITYEPEPPNSSQPTESADCDDFDCSDDLFSDSNTLEEEEESEESPTPSPPNDQNEDNLKTWSNCQPVLPPLQPSSNHTITIRPHFKQSCAPRPYPDTFRDAWDCTHVKMPCTQHLTYNLESTTITRWDVIGSALRSTKISTTEEFENAVMRYNPQHASRWNFRGLRHFVKNCLDSNHQLIFFDYIVPCIIDLALQLPEVCTMPIPLLKKNVDHSITLSQKQIACLLANAFLCTFPKRNPIHFTAIRSRSEYMTYPDINFNKLFSGLRSGISSKNSEKLKCLLHYFIRVTEKEPDGTVTFHRQCIENFPDWRSSKQPLRDVVVHSKGLIEEDGQGMLQVDFANRFVGGGVLGQGCIQEEIRFVISPELIIARLFTECLTDREALIVTGVEQFSSYKGYGDTFQFCGDYVDQTPRDAWGRRYTQVVAIDALHYNKSMEQFKPSFIKRDLNKAYAGFLQRDNFNTDPVAVATGNWGCGAFRGSPHLKFLVQLMATSQTNRQMLYFTFKDKKLESDFRQMYSFLNEKQLTVGDIWSLLEKYYLSLQRLDSSKLNLFDFIFQNASNCETDKLGSTRPKLNVSHNQSRSTEHRADSPLSQPSLLLGGLPQDRPTVASRVPQAKSTTASTNVPQAKSTTASTNVPQAKSTTTANSTHSESTKHHIDPQKSTASNVNTAKSNSSNSTKTRLNVTALCHNYASMKEGKLNVDSKKQPQETSVVGRPMNSSAAPIFVQSGIPKSD